MVLCLYQLNVNVERSSNILCSAHVGTYSKCYQSFKWPSVYNAPMHYTEIIEYALTFEGICMYIHKHVMLIDEMTL